MPIKTVDVDALVKQTGNLFETVAILSKRSRQIASQMKADLDDKLAYFEGFESDLVDEVRFQEEQKRISIEHELKPEPTEMAINEMFSGEIYFRDPSAEVSE